MKVTNRVNNRSIEQFNVGTMDLKDHQGDVIALLPELARLLAVQFAEQTEEFKVLSQQPTRFAGLEAYELRALNILRSADDPTRKVRLHFRLVLVPDSTRKRGVCLMMYHDDSSTGDGLRVITDSFRLGKP